MVRISAISLLLAAVLSLDAGGATWHEFDGSATPDRATPGWRNPWRKFAVSRAAEGFYTLTIPKERGGRMWFMRGPAWQPDGDLTLVVGIEPAGDIVR